MEETWSKHQGIVISPVTTRNQSIIEVFCPEITPFISGKPIDDTPVQRTVNVKDAAGVNHSYTFKVSDTITCSFLHLDNGTDVPDVVEGESVWIYEYEGTGKFWWRPVHNMQHLRATEHIRFTVAARTATGELDTNNAYVVEIDSKYNPGIRLHTSTANGEAAGYDVDIDPVANTLVIKDTKGNQFKINSSSDDVSMQSAKGAKLTLNEDFVINAKRVMFNNSVSWSNGQMIVRPPTKFIGKVTFLGGTIGDRT